MDSHQQDTPAADAVSTRCPAVPCECARIHGEHEYRDCNPTFGGASR